MKTFIIYNSISNKSTKIANECLQSFQKYSGWEPILHDGCYPEILDEYDKKYNIKTGPKTKKYSTEKLTISKKSCFYSHYTVWLKSIELNEPIAIVEHDTVCVSNLELPIDLDGEIGIQLTTDSMLKALPHYNNSTNALKLQINSEGLHPIFYVHPHGKKYFAGGTGYILTPKACEKTVNWCKKNGWTQNDLLFHDDFFPLYYINPSPILYDKSKELNTSSGKL